MAALFSGGRGLVKFLTQLWEFSDGVWYKLTFSNGAISDYCSSYLPGLEDQLFLHEFFNVLFCDPPNHLDQVDATQIKLHCTGHHVSLAVAFVVEGGAGTRAMAMHFLDLLTTCDTSTSTWALQKRLAVTHPSIYVAVLALDPADLVHFCALHDTCRLLMLLAQGRRADEARIFGPTPSFDFFVDLLLKVQADVLLANYRFGIEVWVLFCFSVSMLSMTQLRTKTMALVIVMFYTALFDRPLYKVSTLFTHAFVAVRTESNSFVPANKWLQPHESFAKILCDRRDPQLSYHLGLFVHWMQLFATRVRKLDYLDAPATDITLWNSSTGVPPPPSRLPPPITRSLRPRTRT
ncbi:hypothetical protein T492DRAFT_988062 [Pavlovales sp. CCMP2436]|nr:hypothetical protein T492DRAFT_988062 [Pavlovales sp. CCMP2436]